MQNGSPPWTSAGASTMSISKKETSGRQPSPQTEDSLSCSSCSLDYATKLSVIWTTYSFTPPLSQTIGESPKTCSRPSVPTSYSSDQRNASLNIKSWTTLGSLFLRTT